MEKKICKYCTKKIEGHTDKQVEHLMRQHIISKHPEKVKFE